MAKKQTKRPIDKDECGFERIEFQAPAELALTAKFDAAAKALGLSRNAYIRRAVLLQIRRDQQPTEN
jgi:hypothetical protein